MTHKTLILIITALFFSCSTSKTSKRDLIEENLVLKAQIESLKIADTSKLEAVVETSNLNVVYRGVRNPLRISFPNAVKINATGEGLTKKDDFGNYEMVPRSGLTVDIIIEAEMIDGSIIKDVKTLKIKDIGMPKGTINGLGCTKSCKFSLKKKQFINSNIGVKIDDFLFFNFIVHGFRIKVKGKKAIGVEGNIINENLYNQLITNLNTGDIVQIFDIKTSGGGGIRMKNPSPIIIQIIE